MVDWIGRIERLIAISISTVLVMAGQGVIGPVLPRYADEFGVSTALVGATVTAFGLARLLTNLPAGSFADRRGRRALLVGGPLLTGIGMIGSGLAPTIWVLLAWRFVAGVGSALYMTGAQIYLIDIAPPEERGRYIATNQGALLVGVGFGPVIGGFVADAYGLAAPFFVVGAAGFLTAIYSYLRLPETRDALAAEKAAEEAAADPMRSARSVNRGLLRNKDFLAVGFVTLAVFSIRAGARQTLVPLQLDQRHGLDSGDIGIVFTALGIIGMVLILPAGSAVDRFGTKALVVPTSMAMGLGMTVVALSPSLPWFIVGLGISAVGSSLAGPAPAAYVANLVPADMRGSAMGMYRTSGDLGVVLSPVMSGALADATSISVAIGANAILIVVAGLVFAFGATNLAGQERQTVSEGS